MRLTLALAVLLLGCGSEPTSSSTPEPEPAGGGESTETEVTEAPTTCEACLAQGGTWQPEAGACTENCALQDISCFEDECPPAPGTCTSSADCPDGQMCSGPEGCDAAWTCGPARPCTRDYVAYCGCDGQTMHGSGSCPPGPFRSRGECP